MRRSARTATCSPTSCAACSKTAPTPPSSTRSSTRTWPPKTVAACPLTAVEAMLPGLANRAIRKGPDLFAPERRNSAGFDLTDADTLARIDAARDPFGKTEFAASRSSPARSRAQARSGCSTPRPADSSAASPTRRRRMWTPPSPPRSPWEATRTERAAILNRAADLYEENFGPIFALLAREAGKTLADAVAELREAVDFLRYYAAARAWTRRARRSAPSPASRPGTSRWRSSPARSPPRSPPATRCSPSRPSRRR